MSIGPYINYTQPASLTAAHDRYNTIVPTERVNISCTPPEMNIIADVPHAVFSERVNMRYTPASTPNVFITPSQIVTMMDESSSREMALVWVVVSLVGLLLFLIIIVVVGIIHKKTKKHKLAELLKSRLALLSCYACVIAIMNLLIVKRILLKWFPDTPP